MTKPVSLIIYLIATLLLITPLILVFGSWHSFDEEVAVHVWRHVLPDVTRNTLLILLGTNALAAILGIIAAALTTMLEFPGRKIFHALFLFPFVIPSYVFAFIYISVFDSSGVIQNIARYLGLDWIHNFRHIYGLIFVLSLAFFPYVFLLCRQAFMTQGRKLMECGRTLGKKPLACFFLSLFLCLNLGFLGH